MLSPNHTQLWALDLLQERSVKGRVQNPFLSQRILLRGRLAFIFLLVLVEARARVKHPDWVARRLPQFLRAAIRCEVMLYLFNPQDEISYSAHMGGAT